jgi:hypothetical protein
MGGGNNVHFTTENLNSIVILYIYLSKVYTVLAVKK